MQIPDSAPFPEDQRSALNRILPALTPSQVQWLAGFASGVMQGQSTTGNGSQPLSAPGSLSSTQAVAGPTVDVLYGSESGNAEALAQRTRKSLSKKGLQARVHDLSEVSPADLSGMTHVLMISSTWGDGDPPDNALEFHQAVMSPQAPKLPGLKFSVCALGDTSYEKFCQTGKDFDRRFEELGAQRLAQRVDCDVDFESPYQAWLDGLLEAFQKESASTAPPQVAVAPLPHEDLATEKEEVRYSKKDPFLSPLSEKILLNGRGSQKEVWHHELSLAGSGLHYEPGDSLAVIPQNAQEDIDALLEAVGFTGAIPVDGGSLLSPGVAFRSLYDVTTLTKAVMTKYNDFAQSKELTAIIEDSARLKDYLHGRQIVDLLEDFPVGNLSASEFVTVLRKMPPRLYSIASSLRAHPDEVHLTVAAVRYQTHGRSRRGVASTYLADRVEIGEKVPVYVAGNKHFKLPASGDTPIIMVGPGTGIAPFRAFVQERQCRGSEGKNWLFFGDQHFTTDFLYQLEWQEFLEDGLLNRLDLAFSRDQKHKIYVQHRMLENGRQLWDWLEDGAYFYVCGDASRMASDVHEALITVVEKEGGHSREGAEEYVRQLQKAKRYVRDVY